MVILYVCKLASPKGNGVVGAIKSEIDGLKNLCKVGLFNLGVGFEIDGFNSIYEINKYNGIEKLPKPFNHPDLVIFEEIYKWEYIKIYKYLKKCNIPYIIIPHGSLVYKEQHRKLLKKKTANILFFNSYINNALAIQFLNKQEEDNSKFKYRKSIIIPNSIPIEDNKVLKDYKKNNSGNCFVYIGRYSIYTKGLDLLVSLCSKYKLFMIENNVTFNIYGTIDNNSKEFNLLKKMIEKKKVDNIINLNDAVYGEEKKKILQKANFFFQLSRHEGQPMGIIEALAYGLPCIVTYNTSFGDYCEKNECGFAADANIDSIFKKINKMVGMNQQQRIIYSRNARKNVINDFSINVISKMTYNAYKQILKDE